MYEKLERALPWLALSALVAGGATWLAGMSELAGWLWAASTVVVLVPVAVGAVRGLLRGETGVDLVALLAMAGALALGEYLAGAIIALMLTGGEALERYAVGHARRELTALLERAPRQAHRRVGNELVDVAADDVVAGDVLLVKPGELVPADGLLVSGEAVVDESALTGESRPVTCARGHALRSGTMNQSAAFEMRVTASAADSTWAAIVRLVRAAEQSRAPFVRMADRFALWFLGLTIAMAALAWAISGDPVRALTVLVVATPCPLILAAPAAIIAGVSRAARRGIIVKGGAPLEALAAVDIVLLDKTGTVTGGRPRVTAVELIEGTDADEVVRLAASLEQLSVHPYAPPILAEAHARGLSTPLPTDVTEDVGRGVQGRVEGRRVALGRLGLVAPDVVPTAALHAVEVRIAVEGSSAVFVSCDGVLLGAIVLQDPVRPEAARALDGLRRLGIGRVVMVTGDHLDIAELVGDAVGVDRVFADRAPEEKVDVVAQLREQGTVVMVGDGINDAPALASAEVGVAMGARGATAAAEAADVVLTADRLEGLVDAVRIARRTRRIARQSVIAGMGASAVAMVVATAGLLTPVSGALLQEIIDVVVILNALRALSDTRGTPQTAASAALAESLAEEHRALWPRVDALAALANRLEELPPAEARAELDEVARFLTDTLLPHEQQEQAEAYPKVAEALRGRDPTGPLVHTHREIARRVRLLRRRLARLPESGPAPEDVRDLRRALYGLHTVLTMHFAQEEEVYQALTARA